MFPPVNSVVSSLSTCVLINQTVRRCRPFALRRLNTFWPSGVLMRLRKPWQAFLLLRFGWYVRFIYGSFWIIGEARILCLIPKLVKPMSDFFVPQTDRGCKLAP